MAGMTWYDANPRKVQFLSPDVYTSTSSAVYHLCTSELRRRLAVVDESQPAEVRVAVDKRLALGALTKGTVSGG
jgi:hypothetical protein